MTKDNSILWIDTKKETEKITNKIQELLRSKLKRRGLVVAVSGGIDSSVALAISAKALGPDRVIALLMPEKQSSDKTLSLSKKMAESAKVKWIHEDITDILTSVKFYDRYKDAVRNVIPDYGDGWKSKIVIKNINQKKSYNYFYIVAEPPNKHIIEKRLNSRAYLEIVAATNFKQRIRKMLEYYHADRLNFAVVGTPNRLEYDQGFFVKLGDGAADIKPIAHLYKTQVYQMAKYLNVPKEIRNRPPTTDTYSMAQGQDEFYFAVPYDIMDICLYGKNNGLSVKEISKKANIDNEKVKYVLDDIETKRRTTQYLHLNAQLIENIKQIKVQ